MSTPRRQLFPTYNSQTPRHFGQNITNDSDKQEMLTPIVEVLQKRRRVGMESRVSEASTQSMAEVLLKIAGGIEAAIDRQTALLLQICRIMEGCGNSNRLLIWFD